MIHCTEMELVKRITGEYYWVIDCPGIGFAESVDYDTPKQAIHAVLTGRIKWDTLNWESKS